jgi:hypothetical protein
MASGRNLIENAVKSGIADYTALSKAAGRNHAYIQQFVARGIPKQLPEDVRLRLAPLLKCTPDDLREGAAPTAEVGSRIAPSVIVPEISSMPRNLPVFGTTAGGNGDGATIINQGDVVDYVRRPPGLAGNSKAYGLYVEGDSMEPQFEHGALILVDPGRKPRPGDRVVLVLLKDEGEEISYVKQLVRITSDRLIVRQFNPPKELEFAREVVKSVERVLTTAELMGV